MPAALNFLSSEGEMAGLIRSLDWTTTSLGGPEQWPQNLKAKLNTVIHSTFPMCMFWGTDLVCFYNDAFRPGFGTEGKHPALGKKASEVWAEIWHFIGPLIEGVRTNGKPLWFEDLHVPFYRNGKIEDIYWTCSFSAVMDEEDQIAGVLMICTETTEKLRLFRELQESNERYAFTIEASELGTWDYNPATRKLVTNARLKEWLGLPPQEDISLPLPEGTITDRDKQRLGTVIKEVWQPGSDGACDVEFSIHNTKTGVARIVRAKGKAVLDDQQMICRMNGTVQDITTEVRSREQNQMFSMLVENSVDLMAILNMDGKNRYINKAGRELLGIDTDADVSAIPISDFHTPEQLDFVQTEIIPSAMSAGRWSGQFAIRNAKTGEIIPLYNNCHRIDDQRTGDPIAVGTVMRDMRNELNARKRLEAEVEKRTRELTKLNEALERKNSDLASFAFVSSHDLQEPLRKINTFISRIEDGGDTPDGKNAVYFEKIKHSVRRMQTLINDLLAFSSADTGQGQSEYCDLNRILADVHRELQDKGEKAGMQITATSLPCIHGIPFQITQLFTNLLANSIKFAQNDVPLRIGISAELTSKGLPVAVPDSSARFWRISVSDNGIGFDAEYSNRIFEVFQRLHSKDDYEGTGIGLSICRRIMENHGGFITAAGKNGAGATFYLYFPATEPAGGDPVRN